MGLAHRLRYWQRIFSAYLTSGPSQLSFWHDPPKLAANLEAQLDAPGLDSHRLGPYYMDFDGKADYAGPFDAAGIPLLDYRGHIGPQHNPIAIAQYGLGNYNLFLRTHQPERERRFLQVAEWLTSHLEENPAGLATWMHHFNWEYRDTLRAPWYSGLAQGQGISLLLRAHQHTGDARYLAAAERAWQAFLVPVKEGGVAYRDAENSLWFEEYIVFPPTHILNGFIWASWGVYDYALATGDSNAHQLFEQAMHTLTLNLARFDTGWWSLYEQSGTRLRMLTSPFYHRLHIVQLRILQRLTGNAMFGEVADRWQGYTQHWLKRTAAFVYKAVFKLCYY